MKKPLSKTLTPVDIKTVTHYAVELEIEKPGSAGQEVEVAEFHLDEFVSTDPDCLGNEWGWMIEPKTCDLDLLSMGLDVGI
jgi:hypothetical protein